MLADRLADKYHFKRAQFMEVLQKEVFPQFNTTQIGKALVLCDAYDLNPFRDEIYLLKTKGGVKSYVSVDGWISVAQRHPKFRGFQFQKHRNEDGVLVEVTCLIFREDWAQPGSYTESMRECVRNTDPWKNKPERMLCHKAFMQCARYTLGITGITDEEEALDAEYEVIERPVENEPTVNRLKRSLRPDAATHDSAPRDPESAPVQEDPRPRKKQSASARQLGTIYDRFQELSFDPEEAEAILGYWARKAGKKDATELGVRDLKAFLDVLGDKTALQNLCDRYSAESKSEGELFS